MGDEGGSANCHRPNQSLNPFLELASCQVLPYARANMKTPMKTVVLSVVLLALATSPVSARGGGGHGGGGGRSGGHSSFAGNNGARSQSVSKVGSGQFRSPASQNAFGLKAPAYFQQATSSPARNAFQGAVQSRSPSGTLAARTGTWNTNTRGRASAFTPMTVGDASRVYSATARQNFGVIPESSFAARAMSAAMRNAR